MKTLVINAPLEGVLSENKKSFENTLKTGIGQGYAIARNLFEQCSPGCKVVLLSKDEKKRAEGTLVKLAATVKTGSGMQRYDVHIKDLKRVAYQPGSIEPERSRGSLTSVPDYRSDLCRFPNKYGRRSAGKVGEVQIMDIRIEYIEDWERISNR